MTVNRADEAFMRTAIEAARAVRGRTHPNPAVGAIIVHQGQVVAKGATQPPPGAHAEVMALRAFAAHGLKADATTSLYVTLEPCSTQGRTPPCTDAIIASGIRRVVVGATDPNPAHAGRGLPLLREAGVEVIAGVLADDGTDLNLIFNHQIVHQRPFLAAKVATTLDGYMADRDGTSQWITGQEARADVMSWRGYFPAIAVGARTVLLDDPRLTVRLAPQPEYAPRRLIFDRHFLTSAVPSAQVYRDGFRDRTLLLVGRDVLDRASAFARETGITCWEIGSPEDPEAWCSFCARLLAEGITGVLVEGGRRLLSGLLQASRLDYLLWYQAAKVLADPDGLRPFVGEARPLAAAWSLRDVRFQNFSNGDNLTRGFLAAP